MSNRRDFLAKDLPMLFKEIYFTLTDVFVEDESKKRSKYFRSFESCYPFLAEYTLEEIQQDAMEMGIDYTGKSKLELARLIFKEDSE